MLWSGILPIKFGGHRTLLSKLTPGWPHMTPAWPLTQQCTTLWSGVLLTKFGSPRAFLRQIDPWMTFDPRWGRFENMPTNLVGPSPTPMPTFSSIPRSMAKRIAGHTPPPPHTHPTHTHTHTHTHRLHYFSSIDIYGYKSGQSSRSGTDPNLACLFQIWNNQSHSALHLYF